MGRSDKWLATAARPYRFVVVPVAAAPATRSNDLDRTAASWMSSGDPRVTD